jgi:hypothetical protein
MEEARINMRGPAARWPRLLGTILLAGGAQAGLGAWAVGGGPVAAYLGGVSVVSSVIGALLLAQPLRSGRPHAEA